MSNRQARFQRRLALRRAQRLASLEETAKDEATLDDKIKAALTR